MELYLIRHGLAGQHGDYANDDERPLTEEGHKKTQLVAQRLSRLKLAFDLIQTSPLVRAHQTAAILMVAGLAPQLEPSQHLAPDGQLTNWLEWLQHWRSTSNRRLAIVGHEPGLSTWAEQLLWGRAKGVITLKKAGMIGLDLPDENQHPLGTASLFWLTPPRFLL